MEINLLEPVIKQRLNLQSTQKELEEKYSVHLPSINFLKHFVQKSGFSTWENQKQSQFISLVGGRANFKKTKEYLLSL